MAVQIDLSGRVALIIGAGSGIGKATAKALARAGAKVAMRTSTGSAPSGWRRRSRLREGRLPSATGSPVRSSA
jgi:NAD(P)-dependent dehydrogenase (short-subunit alcohol dehydrogenase family)